MPKRKHEEHKVPTKRRRKNKPVIPVDVWATISHYLPAEDLHSAALCSKQVGNTIIKEITSNENLSKNLFWELFDFKLWNNNQVLNLRISLIPLLPFLLIKQKCLPLQKIFNWAAEVGFIDICKLLLQEEGVDPAGDDNFAIRFAAENGFDEIVSLLLSYPNVDPSSRNNEGLYAAVANNYYDVVEILLNDKRVDINNSVDHPHILIWACVYGDHDIVELILNHPRISMSIENCSQGALFYAKKYNHFEIVDLLTSHPISRDYCKNKAVLNDGIL